MGVLKQTEKCNNIYHIITLYHCLLFITKSLNKSLITVFTNFVGFGEINPLQHGFMIVSGQNTTIWTNP